jgi:L-asparaginase
MKPRVLIIYTGGTIGMVQDIKTGVLVPFDFEHLYHQVPELEKFDIDITVKSIEEPIDSSDMGIITWQEIATIIETNYNAVDGFVILHGTDTMAYTASALSFMLQNLAKPVILTGSQLPIGMIRTDGKENLITAIEIAAANENNTPMVPEVAIYFEYKLYRGNRTYKFNAEHFDAFKSSNYPVLAEAGIRITYHKNDIAKASAAKLAVRKNMDSHVGVLKLYPGISKNIVQSILRTPNLKACIIETFGSGNGLTDDWFIDEIKHAISVNNLIILNVTQCNQGEVMQGRYATSNGFLNAGVISGADITFEAAITKLMFLLGNYDDKKTVESLLQQAICGEITVDK